MKSGTRMPCMTLAVVLLWVDAGLHLLSGNATRRPWCRIYYDGVKDAWQVFVKV